MRMSERYAAEGKGYHVIARARLALGLQVLHARKSEDHSLQLHSSSFLTSVSAVSSLTLARSPSKTSCTRNDQIASK